MGIHRSFSILLIDFCVADFRTASGGGEHAGRGWGRRPAAAYALVKSSAWSLELNIIK
jgi:hypothetical protein